MKNLFFIISNLTPNIIFFYCCILLIFFVFFKKFDIRLNIIVGIILALIVIGYLNYRNEIKNIGFKRQLKLKNDDLPILNKTNFYTQEKYESLILLLYQLSDLEKFDSRNYLLFMITIKKFLDINIVYDKLLRSESSLFYLKNNILFQEEFKNKALFYLNSLSFKTNNKGALQKIRQGMTKINDLFNCHIKDNIDKRESLKGLGLQYSVKASNQILVDNF
ncbi:hypothetical protein CPAV1605_566 [seawater metagenome]|uniref:Uncharacterized protein n=1 Tax=seawater metagenome TaxID=1561972 RepID=A0A5E8CHX4_9ZZZZ